MGEEINIDFKKVKVFIDGEELKSFVDDETVGIDASK